MAILRTVACPTCGAVVEWSPAAPFRPFCSERCKLIDAGAWATESYRIPLAEPQDGDTAGDATSAAPGKPS